MKSDTIKIKGKDVPKKVFIKIIGKVIATMAVLFILRAILPYYLFITLLFAKGAITMIINKIGG